MDEKVGGSVDGRVVGSVVVRLLALREFRARLFLGWLRSMRGEQEGTEGGWRRPVRFINGVRRDAEFVAHLERAMD